MYKQGKGRTGGRFKRDSVTFWRTEVPDASKRGLNSESTGQRQQEAGHERELAIALKVVKMVRLWRRCWDGAVV